MRLSGGQKQRLAIARVRMRVGDPPPPLGRGSPKMEVDFRMNWVGKGRYGLIGYEMEDRMSIQVSR